MLGISGFSVAKFHTWKSVSTCGWKKIRPLETRAVIKFRECSGMHVCALASVHMYPNMFCRYIHLYVNSIWRFTSLYALVHIYLYIYSWYIYINRCVCVCFKNAHLYIYRTPSSTFKLKGRFAPIAAKKNVRKTSLRKNTPHKTAYNAKHPSEKHTQHKTAYKTLWFKAS